MVIANFTQIVNEAGVSRTNILSLSKERRRQLFGREVSSKEIKQSLAAEGSTQYTASGRRRATLLADRRKEARDLEQRRTGISTTARATGTQTVTRPTESGGTITVASGGLVTIRDQAGKVTQRFQASDKQATQRLVRQEAQLIEQEVAQQREQQRVQRAEQVTPLQAGAEEPQGISQASQAQERLRTGELAPEETFTTTLKRGARTTTLTEPRSRALTDPSDLGIYQRIDLAFGGKLPGGISEQFARDIRAKEFSLLDRGALAKVGSERSTLISAFKPSSTKDEAQVRSLLRRDVLRGTALSAAIGGAVGAAAPAASAGVAAVVGLKGAGAAATAVFGTAALAGAGVGVQEATKAIGRTQFTQTQKDILSTKKGQQAIETALRSGLKAVETRQRTLEDRPGTKKGIIASREKVFEASSRQTLRELGYTGGKLEEGVALTQQRRVTETLGEIGGVTVVSGGSELFGRGLVGSIKTKGVAVAPAATKKYITEVAKRIGVAGFAEGVATDVVLTRGKGQLGSNFKFNPLRTAAFGFGGAFTAGAIGSEVVKQSLKSPTRGRATLGAAYAGDPGEPFGDVLGDIASKIRGVSKEGVKTRVTTFTSTVGAFTQTAKGKAQSFTSRAKSNINNFIKSKAPSISQTQTQKPTIRGTRAVSTSFTPTQIKSLSVTRTSVPTPGISSNILKGKGQVPSVIRTPSTAIVPTPTTPVVPTPITTSVPSTITSPTLVNIPSFVPTSVTTPVTTTVPTFGIPGFIPPPGGGGRGFRFPKKKKGRTFSYLPSIAAIGLGIKGKRSGVSTGLEVRPIDINY